MHFFTLCLQDCKGFIWTKHNLKLYSWLWKHIKFSMLLFSYKSDLWTWHFTPRHHSRLLRNQFKELFSLFPCKFKFKNFFFFIIKGNIFYYFIFWKRKANIYCCFYSYPIRQKICNYNHLLGLWNDLPSNIWSFDAFVPSILAGILYNTK